MKKALVCTGLVLLVSVWCRAGGSKEPQTKQGRNAPPSAPAAPVVPASPFYTGEGGKGLSIAILAPQAEGLAKDQGYLPALVQGEFVSNFAGYSAISVLDRERLDSQYAELLSGYYDDRAQAGQDLGRLTPTAYVMGGKITKTAAGYALQIQITKTADKMTAASYSGTCVFAELDNLSGIRRASLDLLQKMGVTPTERTRTELAGAAVTSHVSAQTALAQGIEAQKQGTVVEALSYYFQAAGYDPGLAEAASRLNIMSADIAGGNIGQNARNDIQWRRDWVARLTECEQFFANYIKDSAPYRLMYSTDLEQGNIDYQKETLSINTKAGLFPQSDQWFQTLEKVVETVRQGLEKTGRANAWGLDWPWKPVSGVTMVGDRENTLRVNFELKNERGAVLGTTAINLLYSWYVPDKEGEYSKDRKREQLPENSRGSFVVAARVQDIQTVTFANVRAGEITDKLSIAVTGIDGAAAERAAQAKHISIVSAGEYYKSLGGPFVTGQRGPAGGIVFTDGLQWFEAAPAGTEFLASWYDAVTRCREMNYGGKSDWRLPDKNELDLMYRNLKLKGLGGFSDNWYWSLQGSTNNAWYQGFSNGHQNYWTKNGIFLVRAVRAF